MSSAKDDRAGDRYVEALLAVEAADEASATAALTQLSTDNLALLGGEPHLVEAPCVLRLAFDLQAPGINPS